MANYTYVSGPLDQASSWLVGGSPAMSPPGPGDDIDFPSGGSPTGSADVMSVSIEGPLDLTGSIRTTSVTAAAPVTIDAGGDLDSSGPLDFSDDVSVQDGGALEGGGSSDTFSGSSLTVDGDGSSFTEDENFQAIGPTDVSFTDGAEVTTGDNPADTDVFEGASTLLLSDATFTAADIATGDGSQWTINDGATLNTNGGGNQAAGGAVGAALNGDGLVDDATVESAGGWSIGSGAPFDGGPPLGYSSTATFADGAVLTLASFYLGDYGGADGNLTMSGDGTSVTVAGDTSVASSAGILLVGNDGTGVLTIDDGATMTVDLTSSLAPDSVGFGSGSEGTLTVDGSGSNLTVNGTLDVGLDGTGEVTIEAGASASVTATGTAALIVGDQSDGSGTVTVTGVSAALTVGGTAEIGNLGTATLEAAAAGMITAAALILAAQAASGTNDEPDMVLADGAASTIDISGDATIDSATTLATNTFDLPNGTFGSWSYGPSGIGQLGATDSGVIIIGGTLTLQAPNDTGTPAAVNIASDGAIAVGGSITVADSMLVQGDGVLAGYGTIVAGADSDSVPGGYVIADGNGTVEAMDGTLELDANLGGNGHFTIDLNATMKVDGAVGAGTTISFDVAATGTPATNYSTTLVLEDPQDFSGDITNFAQGDTIYLPNFTPSPDFIGVNSFTDGLSIQGIGTLDVTGPDPVPTVGFKKDIDGGTDIETVNLQTLLGLAMNTYNAPYAGADGYTEIAIAPADSGFEAVAYKDTDTLDGDPSIVIAFRGTFKNEVPAFIKNIVADASFPLGVPNGLLQLYITDAASFVAQIASGYPTAQIMLTGHSLGGGIAQLIGEASGYGTAAFNAPGTGQLYDALSSELAPVDNLGDGGTNINYRVTGDQVSFAGTAMRQTYSLPSTAGTTGSTPLITAMSQALTNHNDFPNLQTSSYTEGYTNPDYISLIQSILQSPDGLQLQIAIQVVARVLALIDPEPGSSFVLQAAAGSPDISEIVLPLEPGVASYNVSYSTAGTSSPFSKVQPGATDDLPAGVTAVTFDPLGASDAAVVIPSSFYLGIACATTGAFKATLTESGGTPFPGPITTAATAKLEPSGGATPLDIATPTDPSDSDPADFGVLVTVLPTNATITLADGKTPVTLDEALTIAQLSGLEAIPTPGSGGVHSTFSYEVTDADFASATGSDAITVACYAAGTRIATPRGLVRIEALRVGDAVLNHAGVARPIAWIGRRRLDCRHHAHPLDVWPVRVYAGAFGDGLPARDLRLSPDHAIFLYDALIPIRHLINGLTVTQERARQVTYYHLELPSHDVIVAEGLPAESFLDLGNRSSFENGGVAVLPDPGFRNRIWEREACAPLIFGGPVLEAVRLRLALQAQWLGYRATPSEPRPIH